MLSREGERWTVVLGFFGLFLFQPPPCTHTSVCLCKNLAVALTWLWLRVCRGWQARRAPVCKPGSQLSWGWLKGSGGVSAIVSLLVWLTACTIYYPLWSPEMLFLPTTHPCLMQVVAAPEDSYKPRCWTSRWAALWQSRLPVCLAVLKYWNRSRHCPTVCGQRGKICLSLQCHNISEVELESLLCIIQGI